jgi:hypothetical protein
MASEPPALSIGQTGRLVLHPPAATEGGHVWELAVELLGEGLNARAVVELPAAGDGEPGLARFFESLADSWRGWPGTRSWQSLGFGALRLDATHDGARRVWLAATLTPEHDEWSARIVVSVEAGEQLRRIAAEARALLAVS